MTTEPIYKAVRKTLNSKPSFMALNQEFTPKDNADYYDSLFSYTETHKKIFEEKHTLSGIKDTTTNRLYFDFDSKNDLELARKDALTLIERLINEHKVPESNIAAYFSGQKGWAVELQLDKFISPEEFKAATFKLASDLTTFDSVINDANRIVRIVNSRHQVSGLYKIQLHLWELDELSLNAILDLAKQPRATFSIKTTHLNSELFKVEVKKAVSVVVENEAVGGIRIPSNLDFNKIPRGVPKCLHALSYGAFESGKGKRGILLYRLGNFYKNQGQSKISTYHLLKAVCEQNHKLYPEFDRFDNERLWNTIVEPIFKETYSFKQIPGASGSSPENEILKEYCEEISKVCSKPCSLHGKTKDENNLIEADQIADKFKIYAENFDKNLIKTGLTDLDNCVSLSAGTVNILAAACGVGKSSIALTTLMNANKNGIKSVFFSMDMTSPITFIKMASLVTRYNKEEIFEAYKQKNTKVIEEIREKIKQNFSNTTFDFSSTLSLEEIKQKVWEIEQKDQKKVNYVLIDYFSRLASPYSDEYAATNFNSLKSVEIASELNCTILALAQIARQSGDGSQPIKSSRVGRGSGMLEECASNVITAYRPFLGDKENDKFLKLYVAKNRLGENREILVSWNGAKGLVSDITEEELEYYETNLAPLEQEKSKNKFSV